MIKILDCFNKQISSCIILIALLLVQSLVTIIKAKPLLLLKCISNIVLTLVAAGVALVDTILCIIVYVVSSIVRCDRVLKYRESMYSHCDDLIEYTNELEYPSISDILALNK